MMQTDRDERLQLLAQEPMSLEVNCFWCQMYSSEGDGVARWVRSRSPNRYAVWSRSLSKEKEENGAVWDCCPALAHLSRLLFGHEAVMRIGLASIASYSPARLRLEAKRSQDAGCVWRESGDLALVAHRINSTSHDLNLFGERPGPSIPLLCQYAVIPEKPLDLPGVAGQIPADLIGVPANAPMNTVNVKFAEWALQRGILVLFFSDARYEKFPVFYSARPIGDALEQALSRWRSPVVRVEDTQGWDL